MNKNEKSFLFWQQCLFWANIMFIIMGLLVAFAGNSILFDMHNAGTSKEFLAGEAIEGDILRLKNWLFGIIGATLAGFHLLMVYIIKYAFKQKEKWAWNCMAFATLLWFTVDSGISIYYGAAYNVYLINLVALVFIGIPLIMTWKVFYK